MRMICVMAVLALASAGIAAETMPAGGAGTQAALPRSVDWALTRQMGVEAEGVPLGEFMETLRQKTGTNLVVNWNALAKAGVTRETPVTLHVKECAFEQVVQLVVDTLAPEATLNYVVGDNALVLTTNAAIGAGAFPKLYTVGPILRGKEGEHGPVVEAVVKEALVRAGEPMTLPGHALGIRNGTLVASVSERGQGIVAKVVGMLNVPIMPGQYGPGVQVTAAAKRTEATLAGLGKVPEVYALMAKEPAAYWGKVNFGMLPGTKEAAAQGGKIGGMVTEGGAVLVGPAEAVGRRTVFVAYDLRGALKRMETKKVAGGAGAIVTEVQGKVVAEGGWSGEVGKGSAVMVVVDTTVGVFAPAEVQRKVSLALQGVGNR